MSSNNGEGSRLKWIYFVIVPLVAALLSSSVWGEPLCRAVRLCSTPDNTAGSTPAESGPFVGTLSNVGDVRDVAFSPDGKLLATAGGNDHIVQLWNATTGQQERILSGSGGVVDSVAFSSRLLTTGGDVFDPVTGVHLREIQGGFGYDVAFSPDGAIIASANGYLPNGVRLFDPITGKQLLVLTTEYSNALAFSSDGKLLATATGYLGKGVVLWDMNNGKQIRTLSGGSSAVAFSRNGLIATSGDRTIQIWNQETGEQVRTIGASYSFVPEAKSQRVLVFSPNGETLAAIGQDNAVRIYNSANGNLLGTLDKVSAKKLAFSPDGKRIATVSPDRTVHIVNLPQF